MYQSWRVWDGTSALAGCPKATPEALTSSYKLDGTKQLIIYKDENGNEGNVRVYASTVSTDTIQTDFDAEAAKQQAAEEAASQPTAAEQLTDVQLALCDLYESIVALGGTVSG